MERKELVAKANELGLEFRKNIGSDELEGLVETAELQAVADKTELSLVEDVVEEKPKKVVKSNKSVRQDANLLKRCIITPLERTKTELQSEMFSVGTSKLGFLKKVVRFHTESLEPIGIINMLKEKKALLQVKTVINGQEVVRHKLSAAYSITILPDFTPEEIKALMDKKKN